VWVTGLSSKLRTVTTRSREGQAYCEMPRVWKFGRKMKSWWNAPVRPPWPRVPTLGSLRRHIHICDSVVVPTVLFPKPGLPSCPRAFSYLLQEVASFVVKEGSFPPGDRAPAGCRGLWMVLSMFSVLEGDRQLCLGCAPSNEAVSP
jgi:hypothetical protein